MDTISINTFSLIEGTVLVENNKKPWQSGLAKDMDENNQESHHETKQVEYSEARTKAYKRHGYICYTITNHKRTYVGITNLLQRRLKQHNGILKGGARATRGKGPWFLSFYVHGFRNKSEALSFEWWMHHKKPRFKYIGSTTKRLYCCCQLLSLPKFHHLQVKVIARAPTGVVT